MILHGGMILRVAMEIYRAVYDVCVFVTTDAMTCMHVVPCLRHYLCLCPASFAFAHMR